MLKELIVSVNGREKKIAIIEDGKVTEFYIERGETESGIVGNIYKGRVMRVLPGMQSAFVDIALERDAFLYVSDFFDEEEEFERIVIDKSKEQSASPPPSAPERGPAERDSGRSRARESGRGAPAATRDRRAQVGEEAREASEKTFLDEEAVRSAEPEVLTRHFGEAPAEVDPDYADYDDDPLPAAGGPIAAEARQEVRNTARATSLFREEPIETPFVKRADDAFQRVNDDELAAEDGSMLKDALIQERIADRIHAGEFDIEEPASEANRFFVAPAGNSFQRIDDGEDTEEVFSEVSPQLPERVAAHINAFIEETTESNGGADTLARSFERVSDDDLLAEGAARLMDEVAPSDRGNRKGPPGGGGRTSGGRARKSKATAEEASAPQEASAAGAEVAAAQPEDGVVKPKKGRGRAKLENEKRAPERKAAGGSPRRNRSGAKRSGEASAGEAEPSAPNLPLEDAQASISSARPARGEFATRRGGRRRRRGGNASEGTGPGGNEERGGGNGNGEVEATAEMPEPTAAPVISAVSGSATIAAALPAAPLAAVPAAATPGPASQADRQGNGRGNRNSGNANRQSRRGERPPQPTITDLLREGQEILVQIAKEPISQKGARITSHIALPGRYLVYMPTIEHVGVSRKIESDGERLRLRKLIQAIRAEEDVPSGGFIVRTAGVGISEEDLRNDARYLVRTWLDVRRSAEKAKAPALVHRDLDLVQRLLRDQLSDEFTAIRVDSEEEYLQIVEFVNRIQPKLVNRVKLYTRDQPILEAYGVQAEIDKAVKPRVWLRSGGYLVINQTEALVAIDVNTGKFVGRGGNRLEDTITKTNLEAVDEIVRQIRLRDLGGIIVLDLIDMEERRNRQRVMQALQEALQNDKSPTKVLSFNDFGLVIMTRKRVKQSLERTLCAPCPYCQGAGLVKSPQTVCYEVLEEARSLARGMNGEHHKQVTLRVNPEVAQALRTDERDVLVEIEDYLGTVDVTSDEHIHQEQYDFAFA